MSVLFCPAGSATCGRGSRGYTDPTGFTLGTFITTMRDAAKTGCLDADLDALGMIWDKHDAAWRSRLAAAADYNRAHCHLSVPATTPVGAWPEPCPRRRPDRAGPTGASRTARTGTASTTCCAPTSPPAPTRPPSPAPPSSPV
ncbi:helicase associated domain-containing protein [Streptomyces phaeoluteigriseus]|uniref:Helicase associated domain-containing protein n=1 Tax=Streptomyces phaeoluteigriseus TaxID=114686 RepID=A0ABY4ZAH9_9ACTN|nr:helicase associated domain-containing protein [Streptomyces phaeoluteigriseus]USQ85960.1 helicase associated domain-containing protein [Streptomyces phaeoluteigriseus]